MSVTTMGDEPETRIFAVRESDPADAVARVSKAVIPRDDQVVGIVAALSAQAISKLGLEPRLAGADAVTRSDQGT